MLQIYAYSLSIFLPLGLVHLLIYPLARLRLLTTIASCIISVYYVYKETREWVVKYVETEESTYWYMKVYGVMSIVGFALIFRYYFIEA